jgi:hydroxymethylpyrimidine/phosphomethylpyrimidine kinase
MNRNVLTISALDPSGGTGILADLKTLMAWRMFGMAVTTAIIAQNTQRVDSAYPVPLEVIGTQLESLVSDIEIHAVKIGIMPNAKTMELVVELIRAFNLSNIVVDPVFRSSTGYQYVDEKMIALYKDKLFPLAECVTPSLEEAGILAGIPVSDVGHMKQAAEIIHKMGPRNVIVTGGHLEGRAMDVLYDGARHTVFDAPKVATAHTRGLGDTFSIIIACHLAKKMKVSAAVDPAKKYIVRAMVHPFKIGNGSGPLNHNVAI